MGGKTMTAMSAADTLGASDMQQAATAGAISGVASKVSIFSGTGTAIFGTMTHEFLFAAIGAIGTIGTLLVNSYYKRRHAKLEQRRLEFEMEMARLAEKRRMMLAQVQMEVMRCDGKVMASLPDSTPAALNSCFCKEGEQ